MRIKVISLNCWFCKHFDEIVTFFREQDADVLLLQEVPMGLSSNFEKGPADAYEKLQNLLPNYESSYAPMWRLRAHADNQVDVGLAIFSKFPIQESHFKYYYKSVIVLEDTEPSGEVRFPGVYLSTTVALQETMLFEFITTHFVWTLHPETNQYQKEAIPLFMEKMNSKSRFILGGDFNTTDDSPIYKELASQLIDDRPKGLRQTLHPKIHRIGDSKELAVDYLFHKGQGIELQKSEVPMVPVSDHLPVTAEYQIL